MLRTKILKSLATALGSSPASGAGNCPHVIRSSVFLASGRSFQTTAQVGTSEKNVVRSKFPDIPDLTDVTVPEFIQAQNGNWGKQIAFECSISGLKFTHDEVFKYAKSFGASLLQSGLKRGDIVVILLPNCPQYAVVFQALLLTGIVPSCISPGLAPAEIKQLVAQTSAKALVTIPDFLPLVKALTADPAGASIQKIISVGAPQEGAHSFFDMIKTDPSGAEFIEGSKIDTKIEPALILWSSGTTGLPKGVVISHGNLLAQMQQITVKNEVTMYEPGKEVVMGLIPFFHVMGAVILCNISLQLGCKVMTLPKFDPQLFTKVFNEQKFTVSHLVPPLLSFLAVNPAITREAFERLHTIVAGAAATPVHVIDAVFKKAEKYVFFQEAYGMTEASGATHTLIPATKNTRLSSVGSVLPSTECKIVDVNTGEALGPNQNGELVVRGPQVMQGYLHNREATRNTIDKDGWLRTGDIGYYNEEELFYIVDRLKELIKVKGLQVAPSELESVLGSFPKVADVAVIGVPDERSGELPRGYVVKRDPNLTAEDIHAFLKEKLAAHKQLKGGIEFVDAIPKSPAGKILRKDLRAAYAEKSGS